MKNSVSIKGVRNKLLIQVSEDVKPEQVANILDRRLSEENKDVWKNSSLILNTGGMNLSQQDLRGIRKLFEEKYKMYFSELQSLSEDTCITGKKMGWVVSSGLAKSPKKAQPPPVERAVKSVKNTAFETEYIRNTVRSGRRIESAGHVFVLGDVNRGAEIYAGGDIIVFGVLRGAVFAGSIGNNDKAVIGSLRMEPVQVGIGQYLSRSPDITEVAAESTQSAAYPEIARVENGQIIIESYR